MEEWLSVREIAEQTGWPDKTIRRYIDDFPDFILVRRIDRILRVPKESVEIMDQIRYLYQKGWGKERIKKLLGDMHPMNIVKDTSVGSPPTSPVLTRGDLVSMKNLLFEMGEAYKQSQERIEQLEEEIRALRGTLEKRDQTIIEEVKGMNQTLSRVEAYTERKRGIFGEWFGRKKR
ncbi:hypothetical protein [Desmospora activa]|uniref:Uncharacterized protein n=1 Tax=Desmospora activa DSM 45169 TaxID=1121389 RepID=A0A2T4YZN4_9BACL|nr:hypothetical protein [Desmospora activa]PTM52703.1 hypothetical protein C8J48_3696 [Desmospora activa DSM 45169]